jgi:hypothetical protein
VFFTPVYCQSIPYQVLMQLALTHILSQNMEAKGNSAPYLIQEVGTFTNWLSVACLGLCGVPGFNITHAVKRGGIPITRTANAVNERSLI